MKIALLSDIHANLRALQACLAHAAAQGAGRLAVLGDLVGYGAQPAEVVRRIRGLAGDGAIVLKGNHDGYAVAPPGQAHSLDQSGAAWTRERLDPEALDFLAALPLTATVDAALLVHASADAPERWYYVDNEHRAEACLDAACLNPAVRYVFCGHVHEQALFFRGAGQGLMRFAPTPGVPIPVPPHRRWLATVGSVGQPRDGDTRAMYALFDTDRAELTFHRVAYDHLAAAADVRAAGLPGHFAARLEAGL
ncbi:metallophosphoesterase [Polaromonas sp. JS666]|uniref:metallophosphoesterase family protein n=1 Tax=Polaromonas sp. (strain JS666 / ATCC BAA-500) TaxID=296591 RepID=UPI00088CC348|nr:metallophosphoesterase family protein [Polaromonas sp. JS666]SDM79849.1 3',5'-cyclic AMP phosphodiesterase CpdA [Polaromonas sp. JS666]